jgi:acyl-CoA synthetase (AMP-forming)/AMP-acid ligase II
VNIVELAHQQAHLRPNSAAIIEEGRGWRHVTTFADLERAAAEVAAQLAAAGLHPGNRVLIFVPMSAALYITLSGVLRLGLTAVFVDPSAGLRHIERCCALCRPQAMVGVVRAQLLCLASPALRAIPLRLTVGDGLPIPGAHPLRLNADRPQHQEISPLAQDDPALITFTSGSTGLPRALVRSHGFLLEQHRALARELDLQPDQIDLATMPIVTLANLGCGVTSLLPQADLRRPGQIDPAPVVAQCLRSRPTNIVASPALLERLAAYCLARRLTLPSLRRIFSGGAPVFPQLLDWAQEMAPQASVAALYGSSEAEPIAAVTREQIGAADREATRDGHGLLAGAPVETLRLAILPDRWGQALGPLTVREFAALRLPAGLPGEIVVSGSHVLRGYLDGHGDEETKIQVGAEVWHRTGDAGYLDARDRLWLLGRCAARISDERGTIYPFAVEGAVASLPRVRRSALIGHRGRRVLLLEADGASSALLAQTNLAWAQIDETRYVRRLPVDQRHNAKIDYTALRRLLERG